MLVKLIRIILLPFVPIYYIVTWCRNKLYDLGLKTSKAYDFPVICVGNLSTGGTGKSPMIEYLIRLLREKKSLATLSRGYRRKTAGFVLAGDKTTVHDIGDEPFQFYTKFKTTIKVAVDGNRQHGIARLVGLNNPPEVILLDDAFQHRKVKAGLYILLTSYDKLYSSDMVLPTGNLREPVSGARRAQIVVVTKCHPNISKKEKERIVSSLKLKPYQKSFFSYITYSDRVFSFDQSLQLKMLPKFTLVTGIANAASLVTYLKKKELEFDHLEFIDHYDFKTSDIELLNSKQCILTTEKDFVRLESYKSLRSKLFYLPIEIEIDRRDEFDAEIIRFVN